MHRHLPPHLPRRLPLAMAAGASLAAGAALAGPDLVDYPEGFETGFVRYHTLDKPDRGITRFFYMNRQALEAARPDEPLPDGTVIVMEDHAVRTDGDTPVTDAEGAFIPTDEVKNVFVMEKQPGWGADYPEALRNGEWDYARFEPSGARVEGETTACFECHKPQAEQDFTFTVMPFLEARAE